MEIQGVTSVLTGTGQTVGATTVDLVTVPTTSGTVIQFITLVMIIDAVSAAVSSRGRHCCFKNVAGTVTLIQENNYYNLDELSPTATTATVISGTDIILRMTGGAGRTFDYQAEARIITL